MGRHYVIPGDDMIDSVVCAAIDRVDSILALHIDEPDEDPATVANRSGEIAAAVDLGYAAVCKVAAGAVRRGRTGASSWQHTVAVHAKRRICVQQGGTP